MYLSSALEIARCFWIALFTLKGRVQKQFCFKSKTECTLFTTYMNIHFFNYNFSNWGIKKYTNHYDKVRMSGIMVALHLILYFMSLKYFLSSELFKGQFLTIGFDTMLYSATLLHLRVLCITPGNHQDYTFIRDKNNNHPFPPEACKMENSGV